MTSTTWKSVKLKELMEEGDRENEGRKARDADLRQQGLIHGVSPILNQFGSWAVTEWGIECLTHPYCIEAYRVHEIDWLDHVTSKTWCVAMDFARALEVARRRWPEISRPQRQPTAAPKISVRSISPRRRYGILLRDGFKCSVCGRTAADDGVRLHVDHQQPVSKGGRDDDENLWTLCSDCNLGKSDRLS